MRFSLLPLAKFAKGGAKLLLYRSGPINNLRRLENRKTAKTAVSILVGCLATHLVLTSFSSGEPLHCRLASDPYLKGKAEDGQCFEYAIALSSRLAANGIHGQLIFYRWRFPARHLEGSHVFVMYQLADKTRWIVDNETAHPKAVPADASLLQVIFLLSNAPTASVEIELQEELNHRSYF
jgi:hypothetical protein